MSKYSRNIEKMSTYGRNIEKISTYERSIENMSTYGRNEKMSTNGRNIEKMSTYGKSRLTTYGIGNSTQAFTKVKSPRQKRSNYDSNCSCGAKTTAAANTAIPGYDYIRFLGEGGFGSVQLFQQLSSGTTVAIKSMSYVVNGCCAYEEIEAEYEIVTNIIHPNITRYYGFHTNIDLRMCYIVMEYASRGSLRNLLYEQSMKNEYFGLRTALRMIRDVIMGVQFLNSYRVLHCDLKPENILVGDDNLLKISDFGLASLHYDVNSDLRGTPAYIAPEQFGGAKPSEKTEIWAIGIISYEICKLERPFNQSGRKGDFKPLHPSYGEGLQDLVEIMLHSDPDQRGTLNSHLKNRIFHF